LAAGGEALGGKDQFKAEVLKKLKENPEWITGGSLDGVSVKGADNGGVWDYIDVKFDDETISNACYGGRTESRAKPSTS
jgi:hypothetical protein